MILCFPDPADRTEISFFSTLFGASEQHTTAESATIAENCIFWAVKITNAALMLYFNQGTLIYAHKTLRTKCKFDISARTRGAGL